MPDPLALPSELWTWCVELAIDGREAGPLELLAVSRRWERALVNTPSLWSQIYIQNGEDEIARITVFLHLSRGCSLHVDIMTALPDMDCLRLIADNIPRVTTISIRPGPLDIITALGMERWKKAAAYNLAKLSNGLAPSDVKFTSCFGISLREYDQWYYCVILMQFTMTCSRIQYSSPPAGLPTVHSRLWEEYISRTARIAAEQDTTRAGSIYSLAQLASYGQHHNAIRVAIPSCIKLLKDNDHSVRSASIDALRKFAFHSQLREALGHTIPSIIVLLEHKDFGILLAFSSLLGTLAEYDELLEALRLAIPSLIDLVNRSPWNLDVKLSVLCLFLELAKHSELREALGLNSRPLIHLIAHENAGIQLTAVSLFRKLAEHDETLRLAIPSLARLLEHKRPEVQSAAVSLLETLAESGEWQGYTIT